MNGILLMTVESLSKRNFSVIDIEDSIPGTFRPMNLLPDYLRVVQKQHAARDLK